MTRPFAQELTPNLLAKSEAQRVSLAPLLHSFEPTSLDQMKDVRLMNRTDTKFILPLQRLTPLLQSLISHYRLLQINGESLLDYQTLYLDTPGVEMYRRHHDQRVNRFKVRARTYLQSRMSFLEVKRKTNKGRTLKKRIEIETPHDALHLENDSWLRRTSPYAASDLQPSLQNKFSRLTLVDHALTERITIDLAIAWQQTVENDSPWFRGLSEYCVLELKRGLQAGPSFSLSSLREQRIRPSSFSKYCVGTALLNPQLKQNRFKPLLRKLSSL